MTLPNLSAFPGVHWQPALPLPLVLTLGGVALVAALIFIPLAKDLRGWAKFSALLLRCGTVVGLVAITLNPVSSEKTTTSERSAAILVDTSKSMMLGTRARDATAFNQAAVEAFGAGKLNVLTYDSGIQQWSGGELHPQTSGRSTRLGGAIQRALESDPAPASIIVAGDGGADDREALNAAAAMASERKVPIHFFPVGGKDVLANAWISGLRTPPYSRPNSAASVDVWVASQQLGSPLKVSVLDPAGKVIDTSTVKPAAEPSVVTLKVPVGLRTETYRVTVDAGVEEAVTEDNELTFSLIVSDPKIRVLYMEGSHLFLTVDNATRQSKWNAMELKSRAWEATGEIESDLYTVTNQWAASSLLVKVNRFLGGAMELDTSSKFPSTRDEIFKYDVIICSDIARANFNEQQMKAVLDLVTQRGGGFCMIGGKTSFNIGSYDKTLWEKITPVDMMEAAYGAVDYRTTTLVPKEIRQHPIWRLSPDAHENDEILDSHPAFWGHHDIRRAKPGAFVLATLEDQVSPVIAVQSYGRGRSMAFLPDSNGSWGQEYMHWGEEESQSQITESQEDGNILQSIKGKRDEDAVPPDMPHPSPHYAQFWVNTVRWLGENSVRRLGEGISARAHDSVARPGRDLGVSAEITAGLSPEELAGTQVTVRLFLPGSQPQRLVWNQERREFSGSLQIPAGLDSKSVGLVFEAKSKDFELTNRLDLPVLFLNPEIEDTTANTSLLRDLAATTGGKQVASAKEAASLLHADIDASEKTEVFRDRLAWDRAFFWAILVALLGGEWLVRKLGRMPV